METLETLTKRYNDCEDAQAKGACGDDCERCRYHIPTGVYNMLAYLDDICGDMDMYGGE